MRDSSLMQLMWLASPALPVGGFSYSEGLEAAVDHGIVNTEAEASQWLVDQLHLSLARADLAVVAQAIPAWQACGDDNDNDTDNASDADASPATNKAIAIRSAQDRLRALANWVLQTRDSSEMRAQAEQMGRSLLACLRLQNKATPAQCALLENLPPSYPLAFALAASHTGAARPSCLVCYAFGWAENMVQAALKSMPLGQSGGQRILAALEAEIPAAVAQAQRIDYLCQQAYTPGLAILSSQHEAQYSRLFRS